MSVFEIDALREKINGQLRPSQRIHPEDPVLGLVTLNAELMKAFTEAMSAKQEENLLLSNAAMEQHVQKSKDIASGLIQNAGMHVAKYIQEVTAEGEAKIQEAAQRAKSDLEQSLWATKIGGYLFLIAASIFLGMALCTLLMPLLPHKG